MTERGLFRKIPGWILPVFLLLLLTSTAFAEKTPDSREGLPPLIPIEDFFRNPKQTAFAISPDGTHLAWLAPWKQRLNVHVRAVGSDGVIRATEVEDRDIAGFFWANNNQIVYVRDQGGNENFHLFLVSRDGEDRNDLTPFPDVRAGVIDDLEEHPDEMLITMNREDPTVFDVYRLTLSTGNLERIAENPGNITGWLTDHDGRLRAAVASDGLQTVLLYRKTEEDVFRPVLTTDFRTSVSPLAFTFDNRHLFVSSNRGRDRRAIVELDPETGKEIRVLFEHPEVDVSALLLSDHREVVEGVAYVTDRVHYTFFDEKRKKMQEYLTSRFPDMRVALADRSREESRYIVSVASDRYPGAFYLFDPSDKSLKKLAELAPWLNSDHLAPMKPIEYRNRDGQTIFGYLTLPVGVTPKHLPVVVNPHGGPEARSVWGYDDSAQFLANRGYAVLQMNFRGSTGYGRAFWEAGFKEWGKAMQDDITDGVRWLIDQGIADPDRIAIYGASYGGYAALAGLAFTPDLYAAGVSYVGPSNLFTLMDSIPPYWKPAREKMYEKIGDPVADRELLRAVSPFFHADQMKSPLFVAQGANDPRVKKAESDQIVRALRKRNIPVPYMVKENEGHGFRNQENQFAFYQALEAFLARHLGGRSSTDAAVLEPLEKTPVPEAQEEAAGTGEAEASP